MKGNPICVQYTGGIEYRNVIGLSVKTFEAHSGPVPLNLPVVAVRAEFRLVAAIAGLEVIRRLYGMNGDKIGPMRLRHGLPSPREAFPQIGLDVPAVVTVEAEGLLVAISAVVGRLLRQQPVLLHEKGAVIVRYAGIAVAFPAILQRGVIVIPVACPGERETDDHQEKGRGQQYDLNCPAVHHGIPSQV
jgi:hypothetical protein